MAYINKGSYIRVKFYFRYKQIQMNALASGLLKITLVYCMYVKRGDASKKSVSFAHFCKSER